MTGLAGCTSGPPDPLPAAEALAQALSSGDLSDLPVAARAPAAQESFDALVAGMSPARMSVSTVSAVVVEADDGDEAGEQAEVTLQVEWDLDGDGPDTRTWTYSTEATMLPAPDDGEADWRVRWEPTVVHPDLSDGSRLERTRTQPPRADIVTVDGSPIVTAREVVRLGVDKVQVDGDVEAAAREVASLVGVDADRYAERVLAAGEEAFVEAIVLRAPDAAPLVSQVEEVDGGRALTDELPLGPSRTFARPLLGTVGPATAEIVQASQGTVAATDLVGLDGLQSRYDEQLRGTVGYTVEVSDAESGSRTVVHETPAAAGDELSVTLDVGLQQIADDLLADVQPASAIVAMRPSTGHLVAVASGAGADGYSTATLGQYPPGSVFKIVSTLALLRAGLQPQDEVSCPPQLSVDGKQFTNYSEYPTAALGDIPLTTAFAQSCNTAFVGQVDTVSWDDVTAAAAELGVGVDTEIGIDAFLGSLTDPDGRVERAAGLIGQGTVLMSPLAAATLAASTVQGSVTPVLLPEVATGDPQAVRAGSPELDAIEAMMRSAVTEGTATVLADLPGPPVAAKTGTAEYGTDIPPQTHGWMVAVQGDLAVAVFVEQAESGSSTAGPILREFLSRADVAGPGP
jgi:cell division protein FtsI/penicillin-binding protein 2